jgi:glyceraldehyde 3-phosphate dehydrogenase
MSRASSVSTASAASGATSSGPPSSGRRHRLRRRERPRLARHHGAPAQVRLGDGPLDGEIKATKTASSVDGDELKVLAERDPAKLPWGDLGVDVVIESTGFFTDRDKAAYHLEAGAPRVIVSAPCRRRRRHLRGRRQRRHLRSRPQGRVQRLCTTNCFVPMIKVLDDAFGVEKGLMNTIHAYTGDQQLVDGPHSDLRRARAAAINIVPTSTGAARATGLVLQAMKGKLDGTSLRVSRYPPARSPTSPACSRPRPPSTRSTRRSRPPLRGSLKGILAYTEEPLVSSTSWRPRTRSPSTPASPCPMGNLVKVLGWYDNEWGYSNRLVDLVKIVGAANK